MRLLGAWTNGLSLSGFITIAAATHCAVVRYVHSEGRNRTGFFFSTTTRRQWRLFYFRFSL
jgi:hypothetical protein